ncbi:glycosyltransferase [Kineobactrum salinum]|uniref:Glycosyltransferase family 4 protein n=1 Tax=Kineobactrum salinum TaxID=2708301 RepID=A0A6C0U9B3_9GAMM|nr:glycosyltransferase [Kineobactrum salinum]QIB67215.1 glycosyltransferase family 4 protein [Kineobactrum salinum]
MNIVLFTNTFTPHVGGVARSVEAFSAEYRKAGHQVLVVAPEFAGTAADEHGVVRIPAIQNFNASDFSVALPVPSRLSGILDDFEPDIIHSQHPFLLGNTALRIARQRSLPLLFTHHTLYEQYTHYVPGDSPLLQRFVIELATLYANLCSQVFAPSESIRDLLLERGVITPILVVPTGVNLERFSQGDRAGFRHQLGIDDNAFVIGHLGRLAPEKNLEFLAQAAADYVASHPRARFLVVGKGPSEQAIRDLFSRAGISDRLILPGVLEGERLADALAAMDVFAFASTSETQGMVLTEAMAAGLPVVALDASGVREVVRDGNNGRLLQTADVADFSAALSWVGAKSELEMQSLRKAAHDTAAAFSMPRCAAKALACYESLAVVPSEHQHGDETAWEQVVARIRTEWDIVKYMAQAGDEALTEWSSNRSSPP